MKQAEVPNQYRPGWLDSLDGRYSIARELRERYAEICTDLGGRDQLSYLTRSLVERYLFLELWLSQQERQLAEGGELDISRWVQANNAASGLAARLGLERKAKQAPDLQTYLRQRQEAG